MRYAKIDKCEVTNGKGVGVSLFVQGCSFHCKGCFNQSTWDFEKGKEWTEVIEKYLLDLCDKKYINRLSFLGGEPNHPNNTTTVIDIAKHFKERYPNKSIWLWTGYQFDDIPNKDILKYADYIIDGQFDITKKDVTLEFRGSKNQKIWKKDYDGLWMIEKGVAE